MNFKYRVIGDNAPENREHLEKLGIKRLGSPTGNTIMVVDGKCLIFELEGEMGYNFNDAINCLGNPSLFQAVAAMRSDSDYMQYFFYGETFFLCELENIRDFRKNKSIRKATLEELKEHFNTSTNNNK